MRTRWDCVSVVEPAKSDGVGAGGGPQRVLQLRFEPPADPAARARAWCEHIAPVFAVALHADSDLSCAAMVSYHLGDLLVGSVVAPAHRLERSDAMIRQQGLDHLLLQFYEAGRSRVETAAGVSAVESGDVVVFDLAQPVRIDAAPVTATNLVIPRGHLEERGIRCGPLHGRAFASDADPVAHLLHGFLRSTVACGEALAADHAVDLAQAAVRLCAGALKGKAGPVEAPSDLAIAVRRFIQQELKDPGLDAEAICARFGLSRSALYRLFEPEEGVLSYIRDRRLLAAMRLLMRPGAPPPRVSAVAFAVGFSDEKTFARAFRRRFGFAPSRTGSHLRTPQDAGGDVSVLLDWIRTLTA